MCCFSLPFKIVLLWRYAEEQIGDLDFLWQSLFCASSTPYKLSSYIYFFVCFLYQAALPSIFTQKYFHVCVAGFCFVQLLSGRKEPNYNATKVLLSRTINYLFICSGALATFNQEDKFRPVSWCHTSYHPVVLAVLDYGPRAADSSQLLGLLSSIGLRILCRKSEKKAVRQSDLSQDT